jgi:hypothetical protein
MLQLAGARAVSIFLTNKPMDLWAVLVNTRRSYVETWKAPIATVYGRK